MKVTEQQRDRMQCVTMCYNDLFLVQCILLLEFINYSPYAISKESYVTQQEEKEIMSQSINLMEKYRNH